MSMLSWFRSGSISSTLLFPMVVADVSFCYGRILLLLDFLCNWSTELFIWMMRFF